jgi:hypothetical protein
MEFQFSKNSEINKVDKDLRAESRSFSKFKGNQVPTKKKSLSKAKPEPIYHDEHTNDYSFKVQQQPILSD